MTHHRMLLQRGMTLVDMTAAAGLAGVIFILVAVMLLPACSEGRRQARRMQNATQIRGIQQGLVLYGQGCKTFYAGFNADGTNRDDEIGSLSPSRHGAPALSSKNPTAMVYALLLTGNYYTPEYAISPLEPNKAAATPGPMPITSANYSFALLSIADPTADKGRRMEWSNTENAHAPIAGDRSKAIDPTMKTTSLHVNTTDADSAHWRGNIVVWNDNHVTFENSGVFKGDQIKIGRRYADHDGRKAVAYTGAPADLDDLFDGKAAGSGLPADANALFAH